jgi:hypothetical protein
MKGKYDFILEKIDVKLTESSFFDDDIKTNLKDLLIDLERLQIVFKNVNETALEENKRMWIDNLIDELQNEKTPLSDSYNISPFEIICKTDIINRQIYQKIRSYRSISITIIIILILIAVISSIGIWISKFTK